MNGVKIFHEMATVFKIAKVLKIELEFQKYLGTIGKREYHEPAHVHNSSFKLKL